MIRMGIDASTKCTGWCIFEDKQLIEYGKIVSDYDLDNWRERVVYMMREVAKLCKQFGVQELIAEVPIKTIANVNTLEQLFSLHGAMLGVSAVLHINFIPVEVNQWRRELGILKDISKDNKNKRAILKERSVKLANDIYGLDLVWKSATSKYNDDDISDAILLSHAVINR